MAFTSVYPAAQFSLFLDQCALFLTNEWKVRGLVERNLTEIHCRNKLRIVNDGKIIPVIENMFTKERRAHKKK